MDNPDVFSYKVQKIVLSTVETNKKSELMLMRFTMQVVLIYLQ